MGIRDPIQIHTTQEVCIAEYCDAMGVDVKSSCHRWRERSLAKLVVDRCSFKPLTS